MKIPIRVSGHHCHLTREDVDELFGKGYDLIKDRPVDQPDQFACQESIEVKTNQHSLSEVTIVGPVRDKTQVEISKSEAYHLAVDPPLKPSVNSDIGGEPAEVKIVGPEGSVKRKAVIISLRHIHASPKEAKEMELKDEERVRVKVGGRRGLLLDNVLVRIDEDYKLSMHVDTDEGNAAGIEEETEGELIKRE